MSTCVGKVVVISSGRINWVEANCCGCVGSGCCAGFDACCWRHPGGVLGGKFEVHGCVGGGSAIGCSSPPLVSSLFLYDAF